MENMKMYTVNKSNCVGLNMWLILLSVTLKWYNKTKQNKTKYDKNCKFDLKFKNKGNA